MGSGFPRCTPGWDGTGSQDPIPTLPGVPTTLMGTRVLCHGAGHKGRLDFRSPAHGVASSSWKVAPGVWRR